MAPISLLGAALPIATLVSYLDAKTDFTQDIRTATAFLTSLITVIRLERSDRLCPFFQLESLALGPASANRTFLIYEGRSWTYAAAYQNILKYGSWLKDRHGIKRDEIVAIDFLNKPAFIWLWFGLWSIGAKAAFVNYNLGGDSLVHSVKTSRARLIIVDWEVAKDVFKGEEGEKTMERLVKDAEVEGEREVLVFDDSVERVVETWAGRREPDELIGGRKVGEMGALVFTSGTTGLPKAANISYSKCINGGTFVKWHIRMKKDDVFYTCMPLYHTSAAILGCCSTIYTGSALSLGKRFSNRTFWPEVKASKATIIQYVGETCRYLLAAPPPSDPAEDHAHNVRTAFGNGLRPEIWEKFRTRFNIPVIAEFYASTEGNSGSWNYNTGPWGAGAVGRYGTLLGLLTRSLHRIVKLDYETEEPIRDPKTGFCIPTAPNEPGELLWKLNAADIKRTFQGYFNNPTATEKKILRDVFVKGDAWFRTGDVMDMSKEGLLYFLDRIGDTYRWKSENVSTNEVAEALSHYGPSIAEVNVYGVAIPGYDGRAGCAAILPSPETSNPPTAEWLTGLSEHVKTNIAPFKIPVFLRIVKKLEKTGTHKFVKHSLRVEGVDPGKVAGSGDGLYYWREGRYRPFGKGEWEEVCGGRVKL